MRASSRRALTDPSNQLDDSGLRVFRHQCTVGAVTTLTATLSHTAALSRLGYALSDATRTGVLLALRSGPAYPSDLADALGVSRQVMSNQLACLRGCGLVQAVPDGRRASYRLADPHLAPALDELLQVVLTVDPECCTGDGCTCS
jgi:DNA-binding transcriptional ArsR family regulator